jgi:hypothetical protein
MEVGLMAKRFWAKPLKNYLHVLEKYNAVNGFALISFAFQLF